MPKLGVGEALFYDGLNIRKVKVRKRRTFHVGYTPKAYSKMSFRLRSIDRSLLERILSIIDLQTSTALGVHERPSSQDTVEGTVFTIVEDKAIGFKHREEGGFLPSQKVLETVVRLVAILARTAPSTIAHVYVLAREQRWLSYSKLRELSGFRAINTREFRRLERLGVLELERRGREMFVRQCFLTGNSTVDKIVIEALKLLYNERARPLVERKKRQAIGKSSPFMADGLGDVMGAV